MSAQLYKAADVFKSASSPGQASILLALQEGSHAVADLADIAGIDQFAASAYLRRFRLLGLVEFERAGRSHLYDLTLRGRQLAEIASLLAGD